MVFPAVAATFACLFSERTVSRAEQPDVSA